MSKRTEIKTVLTNYQSRIGQEITVMGWVRAFRSNRFIALNDGTSMKTLQVVVDFENFEESLLKKVAFHACIKVTGQLVESQGAGQDVEVMAEQIEVLGEANPDEYPMQPKAQSLEFMREKAHFRMRTNTFSSVFRIRHGLAYAVHKYFNDNGYFYMHTPIITGSDAEGAGEMFRVTTINPTNPPLKNDLLDNLAVKYYNAILSALNEIGRSVNEINDRIAFFEEGMTLKKLVCATPASIEVLISDGRFKKINNFIDNIYQEIKPILFEIKKDKIGRKLAYLPLNIFGGIGFKKPKNFNWAYGDKFKFLKLSFYNISHVHKYNRTSISSEIDFSQDFFEKPTNLTVSGQLQAEIGALALGKVYTFGPTFRAENSNTSRHLAEFWMIEPEVAFYDIFDNMDLAEDFCKYLINYVLDNYADELEFLDQRIQKMEKNMPKEKRRPMGLIETLRFVVDNEFERITYSEAVRLLRNSKPYKKGRFEYDVDWGKDLQAEHERYLVEKKFKKPVIVRDYPADIKAFYMRMNGEQENVPGRTVAAMDVLFPGIGEVIGGSQREERLDVLQQRMADMEVPEEELWWYLELRKFGGCPHAGFGLGFERMVQFITGMSNIRDVIAFPRTPGNAEF